MNKDIRASIDIGSNSILLLIAEVSNQKLTILASQSHVTQLGKLLDQHGVFHDVSMENSFTALKNYVLECQKWGVVAQDVICTATEAGESGEKCC